MRSVYCCSNSLLYNGDIDAAAAEAARYRHAVAHRQPNRPAVAQLPLDEARQQLLRIAAMSMLQDDPSYAPSGWSHCLTMPQATLAIAPRAATPHRAIAIAATYVLGFSATQSSNEIDLDWRPPRPRNGLGLFDDDAEHAVAVAWYTDDPDDIARQLSTYAATHHDAHLAKYTLACLHAAHDDPSAAAMYRAATARLATW